MTENASTAEGTGAGSGTASRLRELLHRFEPTYLGFLGVLSLPSHVFESLAFLRIFGLFFLFFLWMFVEPLLDMLLQRRAEEETEPTDWLDLGGWRYFATAYLMLPVTLLNPLVFVQDLLQMFGTGVAFVRHGGSLPDAESYDQQVSYRLPFDGTWTIVNGSPEREYSHSWIYANQRYAYDFLLTDEEGRSHPEGTAPRVENHYCYDEPVLAPADGVVVEAFDATLESSRAGGFSHPLKRDIRGGYVVIQHAESEYSTLAHLAPGSVAVAPGDRVQRGEQVGRCGHSGNSSEPHLHFQVQDSPGFATAASLPIQFDDVAIESPGVGHPDDLVPGHEAWHSGEMEPDATPTDSDTGEEGDRSSGETGTAYDRSFVVEGQRVRHAGQAGESWGHQSGDSSVPDSLPADDTARTATSTLKRAGFGLAIGGVLAYVGQIFLSASALPVLLGGAAAIGLAYRYGFPLLRGDGYEGRPGSIGTPIGLAIAAAILAVDVWAGVGAGVGTIVGLLIVAGFGSYVLVAEYDRRRLREGFATQV